MRRFDSGVVLLGTASFLARVSSSANQPPALPIVKAVANKTAVALFPSAQTKALNRPRLEKMALELRHAYQQLPSDAATNWTGNIVRRLGASFTTRVGNIVDLSLLVVGKTGEIIIDLVKATVAGNPIEHLKGQGLAGLAVGMETVERAGHVLGSVMTELRIRPDKIAPELLISSLAFFVVGGGLDGDGGVPDQDIAIFGIGGHRSIFTHSIVAGTVIETSLYALVDLVTIAHKHLPPNHDPLWDKIYLRSHSLTDGAVRGSSAGLAYHLAVDSIVQPAPYHHGVPFSAPIEVHQGISGVNAVAEGNRALGVTPEERPSDRVMRLRKEIQKVSAPQTSDTKSPQNLLVGAAALLALLMSN